MAAAITKPAITSQDLLAHLSSVRIELTDRRLRQLADEGFFPQPDRGKYQYERTLLGLIRYYRELHMKRGGELEAQTLRKITEEADKLALQNDKTRGNLVEIEAVIAHFQGLFIALRARILASSLTDEEKDELLNDLRRLKSGEFSKSIRPRDDPQTAVDHPKAAAAA
jgi:hypothetical protein